jgi:hypothetical protein
MELFPILLKKAKKENKMVAYRTNTDTGERFGVGYVLDYNDETITFKSISPQGFNDGIFIIRTTDLYGMDFDDIYCRRLELKEAQRDQIFAEAQVPAFFHHGNSSIPEILEKAKTHNQLININFYQDITLYGYIKEVSETEFFMEVFDEYGGYDGFSVFLIENIKNINWDNEEIRTVLLQILNQ